MREKVQELIAKVKPTLRHLLPLILIAMLASLVSCSGQAPTTSPEPTIPSYTNVTPEEAYEMISQQEVLILDVRTQEEYNSSHIPDALLIPLSELESRLDELNISNHILVYCRSGDRSEEAATILVANGFIHVCNMEGGIIQWQAQDFPVVPLTYTDVTPEEAYEMVSQQEVVIVDLRTQKAYNSGHIPDALFIPLSGLESRLGELNPTDYILVYHSCSCCSKKAAQILVDNGFLYVYNLEGGIGRWQAQGFPAT
jgi:rhodanese-related sulfurtransferase